jgi:DNA-directed RNA polymerase beta subunit
MLRKLYALVSGSTCADNPDSPQHHEVLLPGFLYGMIIKERLEDCLNAVRAQVQLDVRQNKAREFTSGECGSGGSVRFWMGSGFWLRASSRRLHPQRVAPCRGSAPC